MIWQPYARKSTEDKKKQVESISDQLRCIKEIKVDGKILTPISESKTAKKPGREGFNQMIDLIEKGKARLF